MDYEVDYAAMIRAISTNQIRFASALRSDEDEITF